MALYIILRMMARQKTTIVLWSILTRHVHRLPEAPPGGMIVAQVEIHVIIVTIDMNDAMAAEGMSEVMTHVVRVDP